MALRLRLEGLMAEDWGLSIISALRWKLEELEDTLLTADDGDGAVS
jgi:hypothetical protein